jgi:hypothetical protein
MNLYIPNPDNNVIIISVNIAYSLYCIMSERDWVADALASSSRDSAFDWFCGAMEFASLRYAYESVRSG